MPMDKNQINTKNIKSKFKFVEGYIINKEEIKINGLVKVNSDFNKFQQYLAVTFVHEDGQKIRYYPSDIKGYGFNYDEYV
jgi:hypothetical protein